jgi:spectinomycin phosphotransferase
LRDEYGVDVAQITFLPLGADRNTAIYRIVARDETPYFLKLRSGAFDETSVALPRFLSDQGIKQIIAPLAPRAGQLWAELDIYKAILYPFVEGRDGYQVRMSEQQWGEFGSALKKLHAVDVPPKLADHIRRETYSPRWREAVRAALVRAEHDGFDDPAADKLAALLRKRRDEILTLVERADELAQWLRGQSPECVLCHSDVHAGNILIDGGGALYIVDWDDPVFAPKERDLMFIGGAQGFVTQGAWEEETLFYRGYGQTAVDPVALAYYRYERIVEDIAVFCERVWLTAEGGEDREQFLRYVAGNFLPGGTIEMARRSDQAWKETQVTDGEHEPAGRLTQTVSPPRPGSS